MGTRFVLPDDFNPDFSKWYTVNENSFLISVQNMGFVEGKDRWHFAIHMGTNADTQIEAGIFTWDPRVRKLGDENVTNHLATFYGESEQVRTGKPLPDDDLEMDQIIFKCASFMFRELITEPGTPDYDVIEAVTDHTGWRVILHCELMPSRLFEFRHMNDSKTVAVSTYIKAHTFHEEL